MSALHNAAVMSIDETPASRVRSHQAEAREIVLMVADQSFDAGDYEAAFRAYRVAQRMDINDSHVLCVPDEVKNLHPLEWGLQRLLQRLLIQ